MPRTLRPFAASALAVASVFCLPGRGQDSPSLGDLARQAQTQKDKDKEKEKDKNNPSAKKVFTNDDFPSSALGTSSPVPGLGRVVQPGTPGKPADAATVTPSDQLERMQSLLNQLDSLDRVTLAKNVLQGDDTDFPGRAKWEEQLFAAKQTFVAQARDIMKKANQLEASAKSVQDMQNPNDPRAKDLSNRLQQLMQEASRSGAAFQAVIAQGKDLAGQSLSH